MEEGKKAMLQEEWKENGPAGKTKGVNKQPSAGNLRYAHISDPAAAIWFHVQCDRWVYRFGHILENSSQRPKNPRKPNKGQGIAASYPVLTMTPEDPYYNRRVKGTVLHRYRNSVTLGILALSGLIGLAFHYLPHSQSLVEKINEGVFRNTPEVEERKMLMQESLTRSSHALKSHKQHTEDMS